MTYPKIENILKLFDKYDMTIDIKFLPKDNKYNANKEKEIEKLDRYVKPVVLSHIKEWAKDVKLIK